MQDKDDKDRLMSAPIKHIWFDFSGTIAFPDKEKHTGLLHRTYAEAVGKPLTDDVVREFWRMHKKHKSRTGVFASLGLGHKHWPERINAVDPRTLYALAKDDVPETLDKLRRIVPISMWSNIYAEKIMPALGIDPAWFTHILGPDEVKNPKPALDGFRRLIELSGLPSENILFVGDSVPKEVIPARSLGIVTALMWNSDPEADYCFFSFKDILKLAGHDPATP